MALVSAALVAVGAQSAAGQASVLERLNLDRLQLVSLGASAGQIRPSQVIATNVYGLAADYGEVAAGLRLVFGVTYWESRYTDDVVEKFVDSLKKSIVNGSSITEVAPSRIPLYDVTFSTEFRWLRASPAAFKPYAGLGIAAHVINAEGALIKGTFVERSLDDVATSLFGTVGAQLRIVNHFGVEGTLRGDLLSGFRSLQARGAVNYFFGHLRSMTP